MQNIKDRFEEILQQEAEKAEQTGGKYSRSLARRKWRKELGDLFKFRGKTMGGGHVPTFREWLWRQEAVAT